MATEIIILLYILLFLGIFITAFSSCETLGQDAYKLHLKSVIKIH